MSNTRLQVDIGANITELKSKLKTVESTFKSLGSKLNSVGKTISTRVTLPILAMGGAMIKTAGDFEQSMNKVGSITGATGAQFDVLRDKAKELGSTTKFTATEAADGMTFLAMAGFDTTQIVKAMPGVLNLAAAGNMDLATSADIASNILTGFGMTAEQSSEMVDVLAKTFTSSNTSLTQLGEAMKYVAPVAKGFGVSVEETSAIVGMLSDAGIQASMAGTTLRNIIITLGEASKELGFSMYDANGAMLPMADILDRLTEKTGGAQQAVDLFGNRAGPGLISLLDQGSAKLRSFTAELENSGGTAESIATRQMEGFKGALTELRSAIEGLFIELADTGVLKSFEGIVDRVTGFVRGLSNATDEQKKNLLKLLGAVALVGPSLIILGGAFTGIAIAISAITSPIGLVIIGVASLVASFFYLRDNWDAVKERLNNWSWWKNMLISMAQFVPVIIDSIYRSWIWLANSMIGIFSPTLNSIVKAFAKMADYVIEYFKTIALKASSFLEKIPFAETVSNGLREFALFGTEVTNEIKKVAEEGTTFFDSFTIPDTNIYGWMVDGLESLKDKQTEYNNEFKTLTDYIEEAKIKLKELFGLNATVSTQETVAPGGESATQSTVNEQLKEKKTLLEHTLEIFPNLIDSMKTYVLQFADGLASVIVYGGKVIDMLNDIAKQMASKALSKFIEIFLLGGATGKLGSIFGGFFGKEGGLLGGLLPNMFGAGSPVSAGMSIPTMSGSNITVGGQFVLKGPDLVGSITRTQNSILR